MPVFSQKTALITYHISKEVYINDINYQILFVGKRTQNVSNISRLQYIAIGTGRQAIQRIGTGKRMRTQPKSESDTHQIGAALRQIGTAKIESIGKERSPRSSRALGSRHPHRLENLARIRSTVKDPRHQEVVSTSTPHYTSGLHPTSTSPPQCLISSAADQSHTQQEQSTGHGSRVPAPNQQKQHAGCASTARGRFESVPRAAPPSAWLRHGSRAARLTRRFDADKVASTPSPWQQLHLPGCSTTPGRHGCSTTRLQAARPELHLQELVFNMSAQWTCGWGSIR